MILSSWIHFLIFVSIVLSAIVFSIPGNVEMGSIYFDSYKYDEAFKYFLEAQNDKGENLSNLKRLKDYYLVKGDTRKAMELQETLVKLRPMNAGYWKEMQNLYDWNLLPLQKLRAMEKETELIPQKNSFRKWLEIAEGYRWLKSYEDAGRAYEKLITSTDPEDVDQAISFFFSRRQWEKAESLLLKTENSPSAPVYRRWLAEIAEGRGETAKALSYWRLVINPDFNEKTPELTSRSELENNLYALQRIISIHSKSDPSEGRMVKDKIEQSLSGDLTLSYMLAYEAQDAGEDDRALATFRDLAKLEKNDEKVFLLCDLIGNLGDAEEKTLCLERIVNRHPKNIRYLEALGDSYESQGKKNKALRVYEKILRLQGEPDISLIVYSELSLVAQTGTADLEPTKAERSGSKLSEEKLDRYRIRIISLREELGEGKKSESLMKRLVERHPENTEYLKQLGFHYLDHGKKAKGLAIFKRVLVLKPDDTDAMRVTLQDKFEKGKFEEVYKKLSKLPSPKTESEYEFHFEVFERTRHEKKAKALCHKKNPLHEKFSILCEHRFGDKDDAIAGLEKLIEKSPTHELRTLLVSWKIEDEDVTGAQKILKELREENRMVEENRGQEEELKRLEGEIAMKNAWYLEHTQTMFLIPQNNFHLSSLTLWKKMNGPGAGVNLEHFNSAYPWTRISPFLSLTRTKWEGKAGPVFTLGDKSGKVSLFGDLAWFYSERIYTSLHYESKRPEYFLRELSREKSANRELISGYFGYTEPKKSQTDLSLSRNRYTFKGERGSDLQLFAEHLRKGSSRFFYGGRFFLADLSTDGQNIRNLHINKALAYYLTIGLSNSPLEKRMRTWTWLGRISLGGDFERDIGPGQAQNARVETNYHWDDSHGFRFYAEYSKESYLALINEIKLFGLTYTAYY